MPVQAINTALYSTPLKKVSFGEEAPKTETKQPQTTALPVKGEKLAKQRNVMTKTVASLLIPGLGQLWNNERDKGFTHLVAGFALYAAARLTSGFKGLAKLIPGLFAIGNIAFHVYSAVDAQKGAVKSEAAAQQK